MKVQLTGNSRALQLILPLLVILLATGVCSAAPITYSVNRTIGVGSVTGFIETDGTLGGLAAANFIDWTLLLNDGVSTFTLFGPLSGNNSVVFEAGADASATATQLLYDFSALDAGLLVFQQGLFSGNHYYCDGAPGNFGCFQGETVVPQSVFTSFQNVPRTGNLVIGTAGSPVPEPGTYGLVLSGLGILMGKLASRRSNRT